MFCHNCGTKIGKGDKFCERCGTKVELEKETSHAETREPNPVVATPTPAKELPAIQCVNCDYAGSAQKGRSLIGIILAWVCILFAPLITLLYFAFTSKYRCPKCHSRILKIKNSEGVFILQKQNGVMWILYVLLIIAVVGILAAVVLASLNTAREKGEQAAQEQSASSGTN